MPSNSARLSARPPSTSRPPLLWPSIKPPNRPTTNLTRSVRPPISRTMKVQSISLTTQVSVLYEGEQIFFGRATEAKDFFVNMGFECPAQQTVPDFLTSLTSPTERKPRAGFEDRVPRTPAEFTKAWKSSPEYIQLQKQINDFNTQYPFKGKQYDEFVESRRWEKSKHRCVHSF